MPDFYIPPSSYLQNKRIVETLEAKTNDVSKIELIVTSEINIIIPFNVLGRKVYTIFHDTEGEELLIDFLHSPTPEQYAFALPARKLFIDDKWQGQVKAISRSGNPIRVHCREFRFLEGE